MSVFLGRGGVEEICPPPCAGESHRRPRSRPGTGRLRGVAEAGVSSLSKGDLCGGERLNWPGSSDRTGSAKVKCGSQLVYSTN